MIRKKLATHTRPEYGQVETNFSYPHLLNFYTQPPSSEVTIEEFEQWAVDRLRVLAELDRIQSQKGNIDQDLRPILRKYLTLSPGDGTSRTSHAERRKDHYSHYVLRLAFCRHPEAASKFVRLETSLFRYRFMTDDPADRRAFVESLSISIQKAPEEDLAAIPSELKSGDMYKVDWTRVPDLVENRRVFLRDGFAYISDEQQVSLLANEFSERLQESLMRLSRVVGRLDESDRLIPILDHMSQGFNWAVYQEQDASGPVDHITADMVQKLDQQKHLPLCMSVMHRAANRDHHAKYNARTYLTRFLKHAGMEIDDCLTYWRRVFCGLSEDKFKEHSYNIRHQYGLVGSRINYQSPRCIDIADKIPSGNDTCGCPYRYMQPHALEERLKGYGVNDKADLSYIRQCNENKQYHLSCSHVYSLTHPNDTTKYEGNIMSPNQYFARAYEQMKAASK